MIRNIKGFFRTSSQQENPQKQQQCHKDEKEQKELKQTTKNNTYDESSGGDGNTGSGQRQQQHQQQQQQQTTIIMKKSSNRKYHFRNPGDVETRFDWFNYIKDYSYMTMKDTLLRTTDHVDGNFNVNIIDCSHGNEDDYKEHYSEEDDNKATKVLGTGQYGYVKLIHDKNNNENEKDEEDNADGKLDNNDSNNNNKTNEKKACKVLRKGVSVQDNVLYAPISPEILKQECYALRTLDGQHNCLKLYEVYESAQHLYLITELCLGQTMMDYIDDITNAGDNNMNMMMTTYDISKISCQLVDAINWCHVHDIIHRDVKPDNIMFKTKQKTTPTLSSSSLSQTGDICLIDFGSSCCTCGLGSTTSSNSRMHNDDKKKNDDVIDKEEGVSENTIKHTTFVGTPFYASPEMYQKTIGYNDKTDLWSIGVTLYVLVGGYPTSDTLQDVFNILHQYNNRRNLKDNLPFNNHKNKHKGEYGDFDEDGDGDYVSLSLPDSYHDMLDELLNYKHLQRKSANVMLEHEFVTLWKRKKGIR